MHITELAGQIHQLQQLTELLLRELRDAKEEIRRIGNTVDGVANDVQSIKRG